MERPDVASGLSALLHWSGTWSRGPLSAGTRKLPLLEAFLAEYRPALRGTEGHRGVLTARRAGGLGLDAVAHRGPGTHPVRPFRLARFATLRFVLELLVGKEQLLTRRPDEL